MTAIGDRQPRLRSRAMTAPWSALAVILIVLSWRAAGAADLPSWNEGAAKSAILDFVADVTTPNTDDFVPVSERIAVFDNDGTLWVEQPMYVQGVFALTASRRSPRSIPNGGPSSRSRP